MTYKIKIDHSVQIIFAISFLKENHKTFIISSTCLEGQMTLAHGVQVQSKGILEKVGNKF